MLVLVGAALAVIAVGAMVPVFRGMSDTVKQTHRIMAGEMTDAEHVKLIQGAIRDQDYSIVAHLAIAGLQVCMLLAWGGWLIGLFSLVWVAVSVLIIRNALGKRRYWQNRLREVEDMVVNEAKVDEEAERILRHGQ